MPSRRVLNPLLVLALITVVGPAWAVGPLDGSYAVTASGEDFDPFQMYIVVLQNGNSLGMALLDPTSFWSYGFGTLDGDQRVAGPIIESIDNAEIGRFDLRFQNNAVTGTITQFDFTLTVSGGKFF